jgi:hypothetical protein
MTEAAVLELELPLERFHMVAAGLQFMIGRPDTEEWLYLLWDKRFDEVLCRCGDMTARVKCKRVYYDDRIKDEKWRIELGEVIATENWREANPVDIILESTVLG